MTTDIAPPLNLLDPATFDALERVAVLYAQSQLIPPDLQGKPADVAVAFAMANAMGVSPLIVMQNIYLVHGRAGWSSQFMIARANGSGVLRDRITWRVEDVDDDIIVTAMATIASSGELVTATVTLKTAKAEGWAARGRSNTPSKYETMPELMLQYRSASQLVRLCMPEVMLGYSTAEELQDIVNADVVEEPIGIRPGASQQEKLLAVLDATASPAAGDDPPPGPVPSLDVESKGTESPTTNPATPTPKEIAKAKKKAVERLDREKVILAIQDATTSIKQSGVDGVARITRAKKKAGIDGNQIIVRCGLKKLEAYAGALMDEIEDLGSA